MANPIPNDSSTLRASSKAAFRDLVVLLAARGQQLTETLRRRFEEGRANAVDALTTRKHEFAFAVIPGPERK